jgi:uncharacterized membrane protein
VAEIAGAVGLFTRRFAAAAAGGLALLLIAVFPANVHAAQTGLTIGGHAVLDVARRGLIQVVFLVAVVTAGFGPYVRARRSRAVAPSKRALTAR